MPVRPLHNAARSADALAMAMQSVSLGNPVLTPDAEDDGADLDDFFYDVPGSMPGTLSIESDAHPPTIFLIDYCGDDCDAHKVKHPRRMHPVPRFSLCLLGRSARVREMRTCCVVWVKYLGCIHLVLEDVVNVPQRPKVEEYDEQLLLIARMIMPKKSGKGFISEQVSFILGRHYLLTVQEEPANDSFDPVRERIRNNKGCIRRAESDYLMYALLDSVIDGFFPVLEDYGEAIEDLEDEVVANPTRQTLEKIHKLKRELLMLRRAIWPQRDAINALIRDGSDLISDDVRVYLRDCYDHAVQVLDMVETYRELASSLMDVYLSSVSNRMNEVMKLLTVISTIFIPLTFIVGVYGMNFDTKIAVEYAGARLVFWLSSVLGGDGGDRLISHLLLLPQRLVREFL